MSDPGSAGIPAGEAFYENTRRQGCRRSQVGGATPSPREERVGRGLGRGAFRARPERFLVPPSLTLPPLLRRGERGIGRPAWWQYQAALAILVKLFAMCALMSSPIVSFSAQEAALGPFEGHGDIGGPKLAGSAEYDSEKQEFTLTGAGTNMWFGRDQFHFVWKKLSGDFILRTRLEFVGKGAVAHRKAGWIVRPSLEPDAPYADCAEHGDGLTSLQFRRSNGANTEQIVLPITNANVLQF